MFAALLGCAAGDLLARPTLTPPPTRPPAPTFTPTPGFVQGLVVVTPPTAGAPGVIVVPPGVDPRSLIPLPETPTPTVTATATPLPPSPTPTATRTPLPGALSPLDVTPAVVGILIPPPSDTPTPIPAPTIAPTETPVPLPTEPPTSTPTPYVVVATGLVSLRNGPGVEFPLVAQLGPDIPIAIIGRNPEGTWYQICCVNGGSVWAATSHVQVVNDTTEVVLVLAETPPTSTPTDTPTNTPTITLTPTGTPYPFQVAEGPLYFPTTNERLSVWVKVFALAGSAQVPLPGYFLHVQFRNRPDGSSFETRPNTKGEAPSTDFFEYNVPPGPGSGNRVQFNYKYEFLPPNPKETDPNTSATRLTLIDGYWRIYLTDGSGTQLSDAIEFDTLTNNNNREVFVAWVQMR
ncbi:MAG: hypothetical protein IT329_13285 [Caldilineaceae bacterium]|nr:hypothetical protein [Caldilineaceae bacterium]